MIKLSCLMNLYILFIIIVQLYVVIDHSKNIKNINNLESFIKIKIKYGSQSLDMKINLLLDEINLLENIIKELEQQLLKYMQELEEESLKDLVADSFSVFLNEKMDKTKQEIQAKNSKLEGLRKELDSLLALGQTRSQEQAQSSGHRQEPEENEYEYEDFQ